MFASVVKILLSTGMRVKRASWMTTFELHRFSSRPDGVRRNL